MRCQATCTNGDHIIIATRSKPDESFESAQFKRNIRNPSIEGSAIRNAARILLLIIASRRRSLKNEDLVGIGNHAAGIGRM